MMKVQIFILYLLENEIYIHQLMSLNMRRYIRMYQFFQLDISQKRNGVRYQKKRQFAYTFLLVHLPYPINKAIRIHVLYNPWHQHCIIWLMNMRQKYIIKRKQRPPLGIHNKGRIYFVCDILMGNQREKNEKDEIIVLRNVIHPLHNISCGISILIQLCVCY